MNKRVANYFLIASVLFLGSGCAAALLGGGIVGGVIIADDNVELTVKNSVDEVWDAVKKVLSENGKIVKEDEEEGIIYAEKVYNTRYVQIRVDGKPAGTHLLIKARRTAKLIPDVDTAVKVMKDIEKELGI